MSQSTLPDLLLDLLRIPSETKKEQELSRFVLQRFEGSDRFQVATTGHSLTFRTPPREGKKTLALYGHLDTVRDKQDFPPMQRDGKIYGCGASDMKAGLAVMIRLMDVIQNKNPGLDCIFVFYEQEEGPYQDNRLEAVLENNPFLTESDLALVLEPTNNEIQAGCMGGLHAKVTFQGQSAHSARPWQGQNAILQSLNLLERLQKFQRKEVEMGGLKFYEVITPTRAWACKERNSVPNLFSLNLNYRFSPGKSIQQAKSELLDFVGEGPKIQFMDECPSANVASKNPLLQTMIDQNGLAVAPKQAWTDIARLSAWGVDAVNFGPGEPAQAHQKNEWVDKDSLLKSYEIMTNLIF